MLLYYRYLQVDPCGYDDLIAVDSQLRGRDGQDCPIPTVITEEEPST